jgi:hypothetical protein
MHTVISDYGRGTKEVTDAEWEARTLAAANHVPDRRSGLAYRMALRMAPLLEGQGMSQAAGLQLYPEVTRLYNAIAGKREHGRVLNVESWLRHLT